jgi:hypothetical protein
MSILFCCCFSTHRRRIEKLTTPLDTRRRTGWIRILTSTIARVCKVSFGKKTLEKVAPHLLGRHCLFCVLQAPKSRRAIITRALCYSNRVRDQFHRARSSLTGTSMTYLVMIDD